AAAESADRSVLPLSSACLLAPGPTSLAEALGRWVQAQSPASSRSARTWDSSRWAPAAVIATQVRGRLPTYPFFTSTAPVFSKAVRGRERTESETPRESRSSRNAALSRFFRLETMPSRVGLVRSGSSRARESPRWGIDSWSSEAGGLFFAVI